MKLYVSWTDNANDEVAFIVYKDTQPDLSTKSEIARLSYDGSSWVLNGSANDLKYVSTDNGDPSVVGERFEISYEEPDTSNDLYYEVASLSPTNVISQSTESISERVTFVPVISPTSVNVVASPAQPTSVLLDQEPEAPASVILGSRPDNPALVLTDATPVKPATTELERNPVKPATTELERNPVKPATVTVNDKPAKPATTVVERDPLKPSNIVLERSPIKPATTVVESSPLKTADVSVENSPVKPDTIEVDKFASQWSPASTSTIVWYDSSDSSTITKDASNFVSQWDDKSGNNNHAFQLTSSEQPTDGTGIEFDGSNDAFKLSSDIVEDDLSVYVVMKGDGFIFANNNDSRILIADLQNHSNVGYHNLYWNIDGRVAVSNKDITGHDATKVQILEFNRNGQDVSVRVNSVSGFSAAAVQTLTNKKFKIDRIGMQWNSQTGVGVWDGNISEIIATTNTADREKIEGYLAHKWGLEADLPSSHTYKSSLPMVFVDPVTNLSVESTPLKVTDVNSGRTPIKTANVSLESSPLSPAILVEAEPKAAERIDAYEPFILEIMEPEADIIARPASTTEGTIAFGTDTKKLYVFNQTGMDSWGAFAQNASYKYDRYSIKTNSDGNLIPNGYFATELSAPNNFTHDNGITISFWFKSTWNENQGIFGLIRSLGDGRWHSGMWGHNMGIAAGTNPGELYYRRAGSSYSIGTFEDDKWYHITYTYVNATAGTNSGLHKVYVDGSQVLDQSLAFSIPMYTQFAVNLGLHAYNYNKNADANFSELAIWNLQLSDSEISSLYQNGVPQLLDLNPIAWYRMGDGSENASGTVIENVVSSDYQGKLVAGTNGLNVTYEEDTPN